MIVTQRDMAFCGAYLARRYARFQPPSKLPVYVSGLNNPACHLHAAINERGGIKLSGGWGNTLALLWLVRKNIATGAEREFRSLWGYMYMKAHADSKRSPYYRRILRRMR